MSDLARAHEDTRLLLPWYLNGTLAGDELQRVRRHIGACLVCRQELAHLRRKVELIEEYDQPLTSPEQSFARLMQRIEADKRRHTKAESILGSLASTIKNRWWSARRPALAVSLLALVAATTAGLLLQQDTSKSVTYRTLADAPAVMTGSSTNGMLRAVFDGSLNLDAFHQLLRECGVTINAGPNSVGAYTLQTLAGGGAQQEALACLRETPVVRFAEPVAGSYGE